MDQQAREPFWPSNSDHGYAFESAFCHKCAGYFNGYCRTLLSAMAHGESPKWVKADNRLGGECLNFKDKEANAGALKVKEGKRRNQSELFSLPQPEGKEG